MKVIDRDNKIFKSDEYTKDKYLFFILEKKINHENAQIISDEENYVITNESPETNPWIWTKDNFDKSKIRSLGDYIADNLNQGTVVLINDTDNKLQLLIKTRRSDLDVSKVLRETLKDFGGSGGGRVDFAQGSVPTSEHKEEIRNLFMEVIKK